MSLEQAVKAHTGRAYGEALTLRSNDAMAVTAAGCALSSVRTLLFHRDEREG